MLGLKTSSAQIIIKQINLEKLFQDMSGDARAKLWPVLTGVNNILGVIVMLVLANKWSNYLQNLHENEMWFSNIKVSCI